MVSATVNTLRVHKENDLYGVMSGSLNPLREMFLVLGAKVESMNATAYVLVGEGKEHQNFRTRKVGPTISRLRTTRNRH